MLRFSDFSHLPEVDELVRQLAAEATGLIVVAGLDSRPAVMENNSAAALPGFLPSGRAAIFRTLAGELLEARPRARCLLVTQDRDALRVPRRFRDRVEQLLVAPPQTYGEAISSAKRPNLLVVDRIDGENLPALLAAARQGTTILGQIDTVYRAESVANLLASMRETDDDLDGLRWIVSVQRLPALCPICRQPANVTADQLAQLEILSRRFGRAADGDATRHAPADGGAFYAPGVCETCNNTGRQGDVATFDFYRLKDAAGAPAPQSVMPMEAYVWMLAQRGQLALSDVLEFENQQMRRTYNLLMGTEQQLVTTTAELERKKAELLSANRVLKQRTRELVSLEGISQALITWSDLRELGDRVLKVSMELSKADRGILYYLRSAEWGQILAARGWPEAQTEQGIARGLIYETLSDRKPMSYDGPPPGVQPRPDSAAPRSGQAMPLVAHGIPAGLMLVQSTRKTKFTQGETALLQTMAGYAAVAMQRAGLIEQLQSKIEALEEAQEDLAQKERLESELELARQVQLSMLPQSFPSVPGVSFAAAYAPARQVGGDFYDVIRLNDGRFGLVIADVADKGMPAALYMALARSLILAEARQFDSPVEVLRNANQLLLELGEQDMFVTVFYAILDPRRGRLTYARAGHDHPLLLRDGRLQELGGTGMVLGLFDSTAMNLSEETCEIRPGDRLLLYTDGLTDIVGPGDEMLGHERLTSLILGRAALPPDEFCTRLFEDLAAYRHNEAQFDDMALLVAAIDPV